MSESAISNQLDEPQRGSTADSLATGLMFMLTLTVVQRLVGFVRSVLFCGVLQDDQLGRWSLAFSFLLLAAPLAVLGLPGSFGRYVEYYRRRGQLGTFLRRTVYVSIVLVAIAVTVLTLWGRTWAWLVLGDPALAPMMRLLVLALVATIVFNFVTELLTAMRQVRTVAMMQFVSSMLFALLAIGLLATTSLREEAVIIGFGASMLVGTLVAVRPLRRVKREALAGTTPLAQSRLWQKLLPFAAWIWLTNLLANLFDAADRFMIIHFAKESLASAESLVGQYHSSRVVPYLFIAIAGMVAGVVLPYMSHDWEAGERRAAGRRQTLTLKLGGLALTSAGALLLLVAPILFTWVLRGKYDQGLAVLPLTLTYCVWFSLMTIAQNYLFCAEKARLGTFALGLGLGVNIGLNCVLLPRLGLPGAVVATAIGNAVALALVILFSYRFGMKMDRGVVLCCSLPCLLVLGPLPAIAGLLGLAFFALRYGEPFDADERQELANVVSHYWSRIQRRLGQRQVGVVQQPDGSM